MVFMAKKWNDQLWGHEVNGSARRNIAPINVKCGITFTRAKKLGLLPPKPLNFRNLPIILPLIGKLFARFLRKFSVYVLGSLYVFIIWLVSVDRQASYKHLHQMAAFSHKFSIATGGETILKRSEKLWRCKMGRTSYIRAWRRVTMLIETDVFLLH